MLRPGALTAVAPEGVFSKHPEKEQDERAELYLFAKYQKEQDNRKNADVLVLGGTTRLGRAVRSWSGVNGTLV